MTSNSTEPLHVFVDPLTPCLPTTRWPHSQSCHLLSDTLASLNTFACSIRLHPQWLQWSSSGTPHYDLTAGMRLRAVLADAQQITQAESAALSALWAARSAASLERLRHPPLFPTRS